MNMALVIIIFLINFIKLIGCEDPPPASDPPPDPPAGGGGGSGSIYGIPSIPSIDLLEDMEGDTPVLEYDIHLERERNLVSDFKFENVHTKIDHGWENLPDILYATLKQQLGVEDCKPSLELIFTEYKNMSRKLCLFKDSNWGVSLAETEIDDHGSSIKASDLVTHVYPVRGFVVREINSLVRGYIKDGHFYGQVRIFDVQMGYHLHFYIEPTTNLQLYGASGETGDTAIMFEYVAHADRDASIVVTKDDSVDDDNKRPVAEGKPIKKREAPDPGIDTDMEKVRRQKRNEGSTGTGELPTQENEDDIYETHHFDGGGASAKIFDVPSLKNFQCPVCVWIQSNFADKFGYGSNHIGIAEVVNILLSADWAIRSFDFNEDYFAENFGLKIKKIIVSDDISVQNSRRKKRSYKRSSKNSFTELNAYAEEDWGDGHKKAMKREEGGSPPQAATKEKNISETIHTVAPKDAYKAVLDKIKGKFSGCCAVVAFVYHNLAPVISVSSVGGICGATNLILVSGILNQHKIGTYDVLRGFLHGFVHLLGATHERPLEFQCNTGKPSSFIDPLLMHPNHQLNVGLRPNTFRLSTCMKSEIVHFMMSSSVPMDCFDTDKEQYCGNGVTDFDEECDCGSAAQCHEQICCGERETVFQCRSFQTGRRIPCDAPQRW